MAVKFWLKLIKIQWWAVVFSKNFSKDTYSSVFAFFSAGSESSNLIFLFFGPPRPPGRPPPRAPLRPRFDFRFFNLAKSSSFSFARVFRASSAASPSNASNLTSFAVRISTEYFLICLFFYFFRLPGFFSNFATTSDAVLPTLRTQSPSVCPRAKLVKSTSVRHSITSSRPTVSSVIPENLMIRLRASSSFSRVFFGSLFSLPLTSFPKIFS